MLIFAISISVGENVRGPMGRIAAEAEVNPDVAKATRNKIIEGVDFFVFCNFPFGQILRFCANLGRDCDFGLHEGGKPCADFIPRVKG